jgi:hypothetical protein
MTIEEHIEKLIEEQEKLLKKQESIIASLREEVREKNSCSKKN